MSEVEIEEVESEEHITEEVEIEEVIPKVTDRFCKGNMPMALVWYIKFHESQENKSGVARAYFTTVGKISDIQSGSNQKYIVEAMKWSKEELSAMGEVVKANFVRGQDDKIIMANPTANKRKLATTTIDDAEYSLEVLDTIAGIEPMDDAVTLTEARNTYNVANPRKSAPKKEEEALGETDEEQVVEEVTESDEDAVDDLLD